MRQVAFLPELPHANDGDEVLDGLRAPRKSLPARLRYGGRCCPTVEQELLAEHVAQIAHHVGADARVVEPNPIDVALSKQLVAALERPAHYVSIDVTSSLRAFELPVPQHTWKRDLIFLPGNAVGSLDPGEARAYLARFGKLAGDDALLLLGADSTREPATLLLDHEDARDDAALLSLNRTHGATFERDSFDQVATWNPEHARVEIQLVSRLRQLVRVAGSTITFAPGEPIVTAHAYKHTPEALRALLAGAGWRPRQVFTSTSRPYRFWLCERQTWPQQR